jgi:nucleotide-binding universal stress UspA family protein
MAVPGTARTGTKDKEGDPMFSTIVVGTDGSQTARRAVAVAAGLARRFDAHLHLVYGYRNPAAGPLEEGRLDDPGPVLAGPATTRWQEASEAVLAEALADPALEGVRTQGHSVAGGAPEVIMAVAERTGADLIVVGNRGMHGGRQSQDSVPEAVAHNAPCHVLIAKTT